MTKYQNYYQKNKEKHLDYMKKYYQLHKKSVKKIHWELWSNAEIRKFNTITECSNFLGFSRSYVFKCEHTGKKLNGYVIKKIMD